MPPPTSATHSRPQLASGLPYPMPSSVAVTRMMKANRSQDTRPEVTLRSALYAHGFRFRKHLAIHDMEGRPMRVDIAFTRLRVAVFVDGCFWHQCPKHSQTPKANRNYWEPKLARNVERDLVTTKRLKRAGWKVIRVWEHDVPAIASARIARVLLRARLRQLG